MKKSEPLMRSLQNHKKIKKASVRRTFVKKVYRLKEYFLFRSVFFSGFVFTNPMLATPCDIFLDIKYK